MPYLLSSHYIIGVHVQTLSSYNLVYLFIYFTHSLPFSDVVFMSSCSFLSSSVFWTLSPHSIAEIYPAVRYERDSRSCLQSACYFQCNCREASVLNPMLISSPGFLARQKIRIILLSCLYHFLSSSFVTQIIVTSLNVRVQTSRGFLCVLAEC